MSQSHESALPNANAKPSQSVVPERLNLQDARAFVGALSSETVRLARKAEQLSQSEQEFIWATTTKGASLVVNLTNNNHRLPPPMDLGRELQQLANADSRLFALSSAFEGHDKGTYSVEKMRMMLQEHEGSIKEYHPDALHSVHRVDIEDSAIAMTNILSGFVEANGGLQLDSFAQQYVQDLAALHTAAFPTE